MDSKSNSQAKVGHPGDSLDGIVRGISWESMDWCNGEFRIYDDGDPHGQLAIIMPGGQLMPCGAHADLETDLLRAKWMCAALNSAREKSISANDQDEGSAPSETAANKKDNQNEN